MFVFPLPVSLCPLSIGMVVKHEHHIGQINKHREGTVEVWDIECVHANLAGGLVKEKVVMQSHFLMLEFFSKYESGCGCVCASFCTTVCWFENAWMHRYECVSLVVCMCVCVSGSMCTF